LIHRYRIVTRKRWKYCSLIFFFFSKNEANFVICKKKIFYFKNRTREREEGREEGVKHYLNFLDIPPGEGLNPEEEEHKIRKSSIFGGPKMLGGKSAYYKQGKQKCNPKTNLASPSPSRRY